MEPEHEIEIAQAKLNEILEEENHDQRLANVFGTDDGFKILEWLLEETGFWLPVQERRIDRYELGRKIFHKICFADLELGMRVLKRRRSQGIREREEEKLKITERIKNPT